MPVKLLLFSALFSILTILACSKYQRYVLPMERFEKIDQNYLNYYLVDAAHPLTRVWYLSDCKVGQQELQCFLSKLTENEAAEVTLVRGNKDARVSKNDVLFYADPKFAIALADTSTMKIHTDQLQKIEVFELNHVKSYGAPLLSITGFLGLLFLISDE